MRKVVGRLSGSGTASLLPVAAFVLDVIVWWCDTVITSPCIGITSALLPLELVGWEFSGALLVASATSPFATLGC